MIVTELGPLRPLRLLRPLLSLHTLWAVLVAGLVLTNCTTSNRLDRLKTETAQAAATRAEQARAAEAAHRQRERTAAETLAAAQQKAEHEKNDLQRRVSALANSLRNRPERPATGGDVPTGAADGVACTGAQLYRADGAFLVRESARADQLRIDLAACQAAYDAAVRLTN
jgi:hypothetical protein